MNKNIDVMQQFQTRLVASDERTETQAGISSSTQKRDPIPPPTLLIDEESDWIDLSILAISPSIPSLTPPASSSVKPYRDSQSYPPRASHESTVGLESATALDISDMLSPRAFDNCLPSTAVESLPSIAVEQLSPKSASPNLLASFTSISSSCDNLLLALDDATSTPFAAYKHTSDVTNESVSQVQNDFVLDYIPVRCVWTRNNDECIRPTAPADSRSANTQVSSFSLDASPTKRSNVNCNSAEANVHPATCQNRAASLKPVKQEPLPVSSKAITYDDLSLPLDLKPVKQEPSPVHAHSHSTILCVDTQPHKSSVPHDMSRADSPAAKRAKKRSKKSVRKWSEEEDNRLKEAVKLYKVPNWTMIAKHVGTRTSKMCSQRWRHVLRPENQRVKKGKWSKDEDERLRRIVSNSKSINERAWDKISKQMGYTRNSIQCRERWKNSLDPTLRLGKWTAEEDNRLIRLHNEFGKKWKTFTSELVGRSAQRIRRRFDLLTQSRK